MNRIRLRNIILAITLGFKKTENEQRKRRQTKSLKINPRQA